MIYLNFTGCEDETLALWLSVVTEHVELVQLSQLHAKGAGQGTQTNQGVFTQRVKVESKPEGGEDLS